MIKTARKTLLLLAILALVATTALPAATPQFITILTGGTSGVYYPLGVALSNLYAKAVPDARTSVQATKASVENLNLLQAGRGEAAFTLGDSLTQAWQGNEEVGFKQPLKKLRGVSALYSNYIHIVVAADAGVRTLADLKGKRLSVGAPKSGSELNTRAILKAAGLSYKDLAKVEYLPYAESVELIKNRQLDGTVQSVGLGAAPLRDLALSVKVAFVPVPPEVVKKVGDAAYVPGVIPAGTYEGQSQDVPTATVKNFLVTRSDLADETVYKMTRAMFEHLDQLAAAHAAAKAITRETAVQDMPVPLHPGAEKYYREAGVIKK